MSSSVLTLITLFSGLASRMVDTLMKTSPNMLYLLFGRKAILPSVVMWQSICCKPFFSSSTKVFYRLTSFMIHLDPPIFVKIIDSAISFLFGWKSEGISQDQKLAAYAHLYSFSSTKAVVHWFQIMRTGVFQMYVILSDPTVLISDDHTNLGSFLYYDSRYDDDAHSLSAGNFYHPAKVSAHCTLRRRGTHC